MKFNIAAAFGVTVTSGVLLAALSAPVPSAQAQELSPEEAREIARDAYIWGFPIVDNYRIQHAYFVDTANPEYKGGWNEIHNTARVYTPADTAIQTPNSDTPYSFVGLDLRAEPVVLSVPAIEDGRYYSLQFIDWNTYNFAYVGTRTTGTGAGSYMVAGPGWEGDTPEGVDDVFKAETEFAFVIYRTQLMGPDDIDNVKAIQAGYRVEPLSQFLGVDPPTATVPVPWIEPLDVDDERNSPAFFDELNFALRFMPAHSTETALRERFARLGIEPGKTFDPQSLSPEIRAAVQQGIEDAWKEVERTQAEYSAGKLDSGDFTGSRETLGDRYAYRMFAAAAGIYGNSEEEASYPAYFLDAEGAPLDGRNRYTLRFAPGELPPVNAFWSVTMYEMPQSLLYDNPLDRYLINSAMVPGLVTDTDGGVTLYVQHESPGTGKEANWLPAPAGPFMVAMRLYWPKAEILDGSWKAPPIQKKEGDM
jgi:hypothetical protein